VSTWNDRTEIYDGLVARVTFGWADRRRRDSGDTYRFDFFERGSTLSTSFGQDRRHIAGFDVPAADLKVFVSNLEDATQQLRQHMAGQLRKLNLSSD
jgi:hypothetical protein